jgi:predicted RND superfamily exporter protein
MNKLTLLTIGISAALASSTLAATPMPANGAANVDTTAKKDKAAKAVKGTNPIKMTCADFLALEDVAKPKVVYWAEGFDRKGKAEDATVDVETTDSLVPVIIEVCQKEPKASFWKKMKAEFKKVF